MASTLQTKAARTKLLPRPAPYFERISSGCALGFRRLAEGDGTWVARWRDESGVQHHKPLGTHDDYDSAAREAKVWFDEVQAGVLPAKNLTVAEVCRLYVEAKRVEKGPDTAKDAEKRFQRLVYEAPIGKIELAKLRTDHVRKWLNGQVDADDDDDDIVRKSKDSANRNLSTLKAALNLAAKDRLVTHDHGWKTVTAFKEVGRRREGLLSLDERRALLDALPDDLRLLATALLLTAARPGEIANISAKDLDRKQGTLILDGKTGRRTVSLSTQATVFFAQQAKDKIGDAPLLVRADGVRWTKDAWKDPFKDAVKKARLPDETVLYSLRHAGISEMIAAGMDGSLVAKLAGTSTAMIDKHYGHLYHDKTRQRLDTVRMI